MNLSGYNDEENEIDERNKKNRKVVLFSIIGCTIILVLLLLLIIYITYLESQKLRLYINNNQVKISNTMFKFDSNGNIEYVSIKDLAALTGYTYYNGEYGEYTEDKDSCYIKNDNEAVSFSADSNIIKKYIYKDDIDKDKDNKENIDNNSEDYESMEVFEIEDIIQLKDDNLYIPFDLVKKGFNVYVTVDKMKIRFYTLDALVENYNNIVIKKGYDGLSTKFKNKRALIDDMLIVTKDGQYAVLNLQNQEEIVGRKYDDLDYIQNTQEFIVKVNENVGLLSSKGETKITPNKEYKSIELLDLKKDLYIVEQNGKYGVLNGKGREILAPEFDKIGIDNKDISNANNSKLLFEDIIPVSKNNKWGFYGVNSQKMLLNELYDTIGYTKSDNDSAEIKSTIVIPKEVGIEGIIICLDGKYGIMDNTGKIVLGCVYSKIYAETNGEETEYYCEFYGDKLKLSEQIKS